MLALFAASAASVYAQKYSTYYYQKATLFEELPVKSNDIVFLGNSITDGCEWSELFGRPHILNRGISGDTTQGILDRLDAVIGGHPAKIFMMIGTNDIARGVTVDKVIENIGIIIDRTLAESPSTMLYIQSILPVSARFEMFGGHTSKGKEIREANSRLQALAAEKGVVYIDLHTLFAETESGELKSELTNDGLHLKGAGYLLWRDAVAPYLKDSKKAYKKRVNN